MLRLIGATLRRLDGGAGRDLPAACTDALAAGLRDARARAAQWLRDARAAGRTGRGASSSGSTGP